MTLFKADDTFFIDLDTLKTASFEITGSHETVAHLAFKDGGSETLNGEAASNLHRHLGGSAGSAESVSPAKTVVADETPGVRAPTPEHTGGLISDLLNRSRGGAESSKKSWFYRKDGINRRLILAFVNAKGSCSVRPFDANENIALGKKYGPGNYQQYFAQLVDGAIPLAVDSQPNLERDCKERLPERLFEYLRRQIEQIERRTDRN